MIPSDSTMWTISVREDLSGVKLSYWSWVYFSRDTGYSLCPA